MSKEFGLIIPNKNKGHVISGVVKKPSIFDEDSESDGESAKPTGLPRNLKRQDRVVQEKAVEQDPTVYQYDEVYDEMDQKRKDSKLSRKDLDKKPKYIGRLLVAADRRKRENERRIERQVQREREAEGEEFKDKESFVTSAYKKKLEELKELEEQEKREEYLESIGDVRKQGNLDGFYRHLYDQKVNQTGDEDENKKIKEEKIDDETIKTAEEEDKQSRHSDDSDTEKKLKKRENKKGRQYRKREDSKSIDEEEDEKKLTHLPSNLDADSDFSIDSESDTDAEPKPKKIMEEKAETKEVAVETKNTEEAVVKVEVTNDKKEEVVKKSEEPEPEVPKKPKIDIWKKRTVGVVFDEALQRYYERKALRESG